jgi:hypothetical protein
MKLIFSLENKDNLMSDFFLDDEDPNLQNIKSNKIKNNETEQIVHIFNAIETNLSNELVNRTGAIYQFNIKGNYAC